jgi:hypothetical protein
MLFVDCRGQLSDDVSSRLLSSVLVVRRITLFNCESSKMKQELWGCVSCTRDVCVRFMCVVKVERLSSRSHGLGQRIRFHKLMFHYSYYISYYLEIGDF